METNGTFVVPTLVESGGNCSNIRQSFIFILDKEKNTNLATDATNQTTNLVFKAKLRNCTYTDRWSQKKKERTLELATDETNQNNNLLD